jgi:hypothetical protein
MLYASSNTCLVLGQASAPTSKTPAAVYADPRIVFASQHIAGRFSPGVCPLVALGVSYYDRRKNVSTKNPSAVPADWLDKKALFQFVRERGLRIDDSVLEDFQKQGLMPPPVRASRGRHGNPGFWSPQQAAYLACLCLVSQRKGVRRVENRCTIPVWVWVYWGEDYGVSLSLVRQAMQTWAKRRQVASSQNQVHQDARKLVTQVGNAPKGGLRQARTELAELLSTRDFPTLARVEDSLAYVFDPAKQPLGPAALPLTPKVLGQQLQATWRGIQALTMPQVLPDSLWWWGRHVLLQGLHEYAKEQPGYASEVMGTPVESLFSPETAITTLPEICQDLATILGGGLIRLDILSQHASQMPPKSSAIATLPEVDRPDRWLREVTNALVHTTPVSSPLWTPGGAWLSALKICEEVVTR